MGASGSLLTAMTFLAPDMPTRCCTAPDIPNAMYRSGATVLPDMPTWREQGIQPFSTRDLEHDTVPPTFLATDSATSMRFLSRIPSPRDIRILASRMSSPDSTALSSEMTCFTAPSLNCQ